jgi:alpha-L-fucosidase
MIRTPPPPPLTEGGQASASGIWDEDYSADRAFDDDPNTRWGGARNTRSGWLAVDLGETKRFSRLTVNEGWDRIRQFELQVKEDAGWQTILKGSTIGTNYEADFEPVTARYVRLNIIDALDVPTIWEMHLHAGTTNSKER